MQDTILPSLGDYALSSEDSFIRTLPRAIALLALVTILLPAPAKPSQVLAEFDIFNDGDVLLLPVQVGGNQHLFLLDTGTTNTVYDWTLRALLGDPINNTAVKTARGFVQLSFFRAPEASVGKMSLRTSQPVLCVDLTALREVTGHRIMGVIGLDFLRQHRIRIDFDAGKLAFLDALEAGPGIPISLTQVQQRYSVETSVAGEEEAFVIDTGFGGFQSGDLNARLCERLTKARKIRNVSKDCSVSLVGFSEDQIMALEDFCFGPFAHHHLYFGQSPSNLLSLYYLSRYKVTFDFPNQRMYLRKGKRFDQLDLRDQSGLHILRIDGETVVQIVDGGSPAARAGIEPKDILLQLGDLDAEKTRMHVLRQQLAREGETVRLRLRRGDQPREVALKLGK
jgi:hypothetical protein